MRLTTIVRQLNARSAHSCVENTAFRDAVDAAAEREAAAISTHQKEYRSVFCPIRSAHAKAEDFSAILGGAALAGTISYIKF